MKTHLFLLAAVIAVGVNSSPADAAGSSFSKSVTVTSDGERSIRTTTIMENGVKKVITEVLDSDGKVIKREEDPKPAGKKAVNGGPWLGIRVKEIADVLRYQLDIEEGEGLEIDVVSPDGPAGKAGIVAGDLLLSLGGNPVAKKEDLTVELEGHKVGETIQMGIIKKGRRLSVGVSLAERPVTKKPGELPDDIREAAGAGVRAGGGRIELMIDGVDAGVGFDRLLNDPNLPEEFKKTVREMKERMRDIEGR